MNNFLKALAAALLMLLAAYVGAEIQQVVAERDYYRARAAALERRESSRAELKRWEGLLDKYNPKF